MADAHTEYWNEAFSTAFEDAGRYELIEQLTADERQAIAVALQNADENKSMAFGPTPSAHDLHQTFEVDPKIKALEAEVARLRNENEAYNQSVKRRTGADFVYVDHGEVMYR